VTPRLGPLVVWHLVLGVPLAALLHTAVQTAADVVDRGAGITLLHFLLGTMLGSVVLAPAFALQALLIFGLRRGGAGLPLQGLAGGAWQAALVAGWAVTVGIEPSLTGRFPMTLPMIAAGFFAGFVVSAVLALRLPDPRPA